MRGARAWPLGHALVVLVVTLGSPPAEAAALGVRVGFDGAVVLGMPVPVEIRVPAPDREGQAQVVLDASALGPRGPVTATTVIPFEAVPGIARVFRETVTLLDVRRPLRVRVRVEGRDVQDAAVAVDPARVGARLVLALSASHRGLSVLRSLPGRIVPAYVHEDALPRQWQAYEGVGVVIVRDLDPGRLDGAQEEALLTWVRMGGHLLVVARPDIPPPAFLDAVLPARTGEARTLPRVPGLEARYGVPLPPGPYVVVPLVPRTGAVTPGLGDLAMAWWSVGLGEVRMIGFDPWEPPLEAWGGRLRFWAEFLGTPGEHLVDAQYAAHGLRTEAAGDSLGQVIVGVALAAYLTALAVLRRSRPPWRGVVAALAVALVALPVSLAVAHVVRSRSVTLEQVALVIQAPRTSGGRTLWVGVVTVPYGGDYRLRVPSGALLLPREAAGSLSVERSGEDTWVAGTLPPEAPRQTLVALGRLEVAASGVVTGRWLEVDLGPDRLLRAALAWHGRVYPLGGLPPGASRHRLEPDRWVSPEVAASSPLLARVFRLLDVGVIMKATSPILVGELAGSRPAFEFPGVSGRRATILLVPLSAGG